MGNYWQTAGHDHYHYPFHDSQGPHEFKVFPLQCASDVIKAPSNRVDSRYIFYEGGLDAPFPMFRPLQVLLIMYSYIKGPYLSTGLSEEDMMLMSFTASAFFRYCYSYHETWLAPSPIYAHVQNVSSLLLPLHPLPPLPYRWDK